MLATSNNRSHPHFAVIPESFLRGSPDAPYADRRQDSPNVGRPVPAQPSRSHSPIVEKRENLVFVKGERIGAF